MEFQTWRAFDRFSKKVKFDTRYIYDHEQERFLETVSNTAKNRIVRISAGDVLFRSQLGCDYKDKTLEGGEILHDVEFPFSDERMLPRRQRATPGRANSQGIPVIYASNDRYTALAESRPWIGSDISLAHLRVKKDLTLVTLESSIKGDKYFFEEPNPDVREEMIWYRMNRAFSKPNLRQSDTSEYAVTQVLSELFRNEGYDGICFDSSLGNGKNLALYDIECVEVGYVELQQVEKIKYSFKEYAYPYSLPI